MSSYSYKPDPDDWRRTVSLIYLGGLALVLVLTLLFISGCSPKLMPGHDTDTETKDSTYVKVVTKDSLVYVPIPLEKDQVIVSTKDTSRLETSVAMSAAFVGLDGFLHHTLSNKSEEKLPVVVPVTSKYVFTGATHTETHTITNYVEVPAKLTWWQRFRLDAFPWLTLAVVLALVWIFRKLIFKL